MVYWKIFKSMGNWSQLFFLCFFAFGGLIVGLLLSVTIGSVTGQDLASGQNHSLAFARISQVIISVCWLLLSALLFVAIFKGTPRSFLQIDKKTSWITLFLTIVLVLVIQPFVEFTGYLNHQIVFPASLSGLEELFQKIEGANKEVLGRFFADSSFTGIAANIFIIAILAAVVEEIFFRGCLQQILIQIVKNKHIGIWITAIIFSAIHMEFYGFIPRILLGAMLGYLFVWSGSLWMPILAHFVNNLGAVILQQIYYGTPASDEMSSFNPETDVVYVVISIILTIIIGFFLANGKAKIESEL